MNRIFRREGFSLVELIVTVSLLSVISVVAFSSMEALRTHQRMEEQEAAIDLREIAKQELLFQGMRSEPNGNPLSEYGEVSSHVETAQGALNTPGKNKVAILSTHFEEERERVQVCSKLIEDSSDLKPIVESKLLAPRVNYAGEISLNDFPLLAFMTPTDNPLGTYYRYTLDGTEPTSNSLLWDFSVLDLTNWAPTMKFKAFNADPQYLDSEVVEVHLTLKTDLELARELGISTLTVSYREIINNINRIQFNGPKIHENIKVRYQVDGSSANDYEGPFHVPLAMWSASGVELTVSAEVQNAYFSEEVLSKKFHLSINKEKLAPPRIVTPHATLLRKGNVLEIQADRSVCNTVTEIVGADWAYDVNAERFSF